MNKEELEILFSANEYLLKLIPGLNRLVSEARSREFNSYKDITDAVEGIFWIADAFMSVSNGEIINVDENAVKENIQAVVDSLQEKDYTLLGDVLEYEIIPIVAEWLDLLENILRNGDYSI